MVDLIRFILRNGSFFLFILFEIVALYLVVNYNQKQKDIFLRSTGKVSGLLHNKSNQFRDYFRLAELNDQLNEENSYLLKQLNDLQLSREIQDFAFDYKAAKVISNRIDGRYNRFLIDKGRAHGIKKGMGIVSQNQPVGLIYETSDQYAGAISLLNTNFNLSAVIGRSGSFGTLTWEGGSPRYASLYHVPAHIEVSEGDTVKTSGFSLTFPAGLPIGLVKEIDTPQGSHLYEIKVELFLDLGTIHYVHVVENLERQQIDSMMQSDQR